MLTATVSGSFHRHMEAITSAVRELATLSVRVLSPADPRVVAAQGEFLFRRERPRKVGASRSGPTSGINPRGQFPLARLP